MINKLKKEQRKYSSIKRDSLNISNHTAPQKLSIHFNCLNNFKNFKIVASYISIKSEISTKFLNEFLFENNKILCLPIIKKNAQTLNFRKYDLSAKLIPGKFGIMEPNDLNENLIPEIILTPCLAYDKSGFRLGYGGGYYDKTFSYLNNINHQFISIVVAFEDQKVDEVVHDDLDQKINYILTEKELYKVS